MLNLLSFWGGCTQRELISRKGGRMKKLNEEKTLPSEDERLIHADSGEGGQLDLSPDKEKIDKEVIKELEDRVDYVEKEINDADTPKPEATTDSGKGVEGLTKPAKIKEKLILEEPSDMLSERLILSEDDILDEAVDLTEAPVDGIREMVEEYLFYQFSDVLDNIAMVLSSKVKGYNADWCAEETNDNAIDQKITELVGLVSDDLFANAGNYDENLDEAIPKDAIRAYKQHYNPNEKSGNALDYQNSNLTEISPEEATKLLKTDDASKIRVLIGGKLVKLNSGHGDNEFRSNWVDRDKVYTKRSGETVSDTRYMPAKHIINIADKIYVADEKKKGTDIISTRSQSSMGAVPNTGSTRRFSPAVNIASNNSWSDYGSRVRGSGGGWGSSTDANELRRYIDRNKSARPGTETANDVKDAKARLRYLDSEIALQKPTKEYANLKSGLRSQQRELNRAENELNSAKSSGSPETTYKRNQVAQLEAELKRIRKQLALLNFELEGADETDAEAVKAAQDRYDNAKSALDQAQDRISQLLGRNR